MGKDDVLFVDKYNNTKYSTKSLTFRVLDGSDYGIGVTEEIQAGHIKLVEAFGRLLEFLRMDSQIKREDILQILDCDYSYNLITRSRE